MTTTAQAIIIKGTKEGLHFHFHPSLSYDTLMVELMHKMNSSHSQFLNGPLTHVYLHLGTIYLTPQQKEKVTEVIEGAGSLRVKEIYSDVLSVEEANELLRHRMPKIEVGIVHSGQIIESDQDVLILGDVNPGGWVVSKGNVYVMGKLRGYAHAGVGGDRSKVIVASQFEPIQLRIADCIQTSFEQLAEDGNVMKFAFLQDDHKLAFADIQILEKIRPELSSFHF